MEARARAEPDLRKVVPSNSFVHKDHYQPQIARARERGEVFIVPLVLGSEGTLYWTFPDALIIGVGPATPEKQARRRARLEEAAGRFKVLSDPTRLSILNEVMRGGNHNATTVTELASLFGLSQPTISVHMKMLREAGLVSTERDGNRTLYTAREATIREFIDRATEELIGSPALTPDC
jgi:DNA-binding transcriptional ArsR family regulator